MRLVFSGLAGADLRNIAFYTADTFGGRQARRYVALIERHCQDLAAGHLSGQAAETLANDLRKSRISAHIIFFRCDEVAGKLTVVRILHSSMDHESRLRHP